MIPCPTVDGRRACDLLNQQSVGLRVTDDRVLIKADREEQAPAQTDSGLYLAVSLAAAVDGSDEADSWFVGTVVQLGPKVNRFEVKPVVLGWLQELEDVGHDLAPIELKALRARINTLPSEHLDPLRVGDRVVFSWASGQQVTIEGERYLILRESEVLAVLEDA